MAVTVPPRLVAECLRVPERAAWLAQLPAAIHDLAWRWCVKLGVPFPDASCAWVAPALCLDGSSAVLKIGIPHMEAEDEVEGLRFWDGDPTVKLLASDPSCNAMLLERCEPGTPLRTLSEDEQDVVIAGLLRHLWQGPQPAGGFRPLALMLAYWSEEARTAAAAGSADPGLVYEGLALFEELLRTSRTEVLLATDLHAGNVLRAERQPWLIIDPKPFMGDPAYDATQHLLNCRARLRSKPQDTINRFSDLLEVDRARVRGWTFARLAAAAAQPGEDDRYAELARNFAP